MLRTDLPLEELDKRMKLNKKCRDARRKIMTQCFPKGTKWEKDWDGHKNAAYEAQKAAQRCREAYRLRRRYMRLNGTEDVPMFKP